MQTLHKVKVLGKEQIGEEAFLIKLEKKLSFSAGQVIGVTIEESIAPRLYSIANGETDNFIEVFFTIKPEGELTPPLSQVNVGDKVMITNPHGAFLYENKQCWWIATGTGIAPFRSMFLSGYKPQKLIQGSRFAQGMYFRDELSHLPDYIQCLSGENVDGTLSMRLTQYLVAFNNLPKNIKYYLCGNNNMVRDVRDLLIAKGVPFEQIITEIYF
jgi:ferredoxin--NADP+ reductase